METGQGSREQLINLIEGPRTQDEPIKLDEDGTKDDPVIL